MNKSFFCFVFVFLAFVSVDQNKVLVSTYKSQRTGSAGNMNLTLRLFSDSTYHYTEWFHLGNYWEDWGEYAINDSSIVLTSKETKYNPNTRSKKTKKRAIAPLFNDQYFKIKGDTVFLYRTNEEISFRKLLKER